MADLKGEKVQIGYAEFVAPRASVGTARRLDALGAGITNETAIDVMIGQMVEVLRRNYPDLTVEALTDEVPLDDVPGTYRRVLIAAGIKKAAEGGAEGKAESP
jgi:hypothetical protein